MNDLRLALRRLARRPGFTAAAVLTLALGIGSTTAVFTVYDALFVEALPYAEADRLVRLSRAHPTARFDLFSYPDLRDARAGLTTLAETAGWASTRLPVRGPDGLELLSGAWVTEGFFTVLGAKASFGRLLVEDDFVEGEDGVVVLSHEAWRTRFGADSTIVGRTLTMAGRDRTVVGVLEANPLQYPDPGMTVWIPASGNPNQHRGSRFLNAIARLAPDVALDNASAEANVLAARLAAEYPEENGERGIRIIPLRETLVGNVRPLMRVLLAAVVAILVIACANVSNLLLTRALGRQRAFAVQLALGGGRRGVMRQVLAEGLVLAALGTAVAILTAMWTVELFLALLPDALPRQGEVSIDLRTLGFGLLVGMGAGIVASLVPAWRATTHAPAPMLKAGRAVLGSGRGRRTQRGLVVMQTGMTAVLLVAAGLLLKSFWRLQSVDLGFQPAGVATASLELSGPRYDERLEVLAFVDRLRETLRAHPGVEAVGVATMLPLSGDRTCHDISIPGRELPPDVCIQNRGVDAGYLPAIGTRILRGRGFLASDDERGEAVAVIDETMAADYWAGQDAIGRTFTMRGRDWRIVGVAAGTRGLEVAEAPVPTVYVPFRQAPSGYLSVVAAAADAATVDGLVPAVREAIRSLDPDVLVFRATPLSALYGAAIAAPQFRTSLIAALALVALVVAAIGTYAVMAYEATARTAEFGLRVAFGARTADLVRRVFGQAAGLTLVAGVAGAGGAALVTPALRRFLFEVEPLDPAVVLGVVLFLVVTMVIAALVPALRAARIDPMEALRHE